MTAKAPQAPEYSNRLDAQLDLRNLACPLPVLKTRKALRGLPPGSRVLVEATDDMALIDIPHCCAQDGHRLLSTDTEGGVHRFLIERGGAES